MSAKKNTTSRKAKVTQGRSKKADETKEQKRPPVLSFELSVRTDSGELPDDFYEWETDGIIYARLLSLPDCPASFRRAFTSIFIDFLLCGCDATHPNNISAFFPLTLMSMQGSAPCDAATIVGVLRTLREQLAPEQTKKIITALEVDGEGLED